VFLIGNSLKKKKDHTQLQTHTKKKAWSSSCFVDEKFFPSSYLYYIIYFLTQKKELGNKKPHAKVDDPVVWGDNITKSHKKQY
jgi:hypothetical protein